jgi:preprotein translocase subunit SecG
MTSLLIIIHVFVCLFLIVVVLLQGGKGAELGSAFGSGSSQTLFGARGAATFLSKLTTAVAVVFMVSSLILTIISFKRGSVVKSTVVPEHKTVPALPEQGGVKEPPQKVPIQQKTDQTEK